ncbi:hypothetical protein ACFX2I_036997 [Malus domestica]
MICSGRDKIESPEQFKQAQETAVKLDLDGLVVIGGDDSNTNACLLAENFRFVVTKFFGMILLAIPNVVPFDAIMRVGYILF